MPDKKVNVILGPTSTGKTSLALDLCKKYDGEIISADSRQIYKFFDIGTGKLTVNSDVSVEKHEKCWVVDGVTVWGYDLVDPNEYFSAYDYAYFALSKIKELLEVGKITFLVGGTGFYVDLVTGSASVSGVQPDFELRSELRNFSLGQLYTKLTSLNPAVVNKIDKNNPARLIRAIEIELNKKSNTTPLPYLDDTGFNFVGLTASRDFLYTRVDLWLDNIWDNGLIDEARSVLSQYKDSRILNGLIYKSVVEFISGEKDEEVAKQEAKFDLHSYIRRQQTWFKRSKEVIWIQIDSVEYAKKVENQLQLT